jgi:hypothetical protein
MDSLKHPFFLPLYGSPGSGKSQFMKFLIYCLCSTQQVDQVRILTGTKYDHEYDNIPDEWVIGKDFEIELEKIFDEQKRDVEANGRENSRKLLLGLDDLTGECLHEPSTNVFRQDQLGKTKTQRASN